MATTSRHKLSRKVLKQPDEFITALDRLSDFVANHLARLIIGAVAVVALAALAITAAFYLQHQQRLRSQQFYRAITALSDKDYKSAAQGFKALAGDDSSHALGRLADFYLGATDLAQNQPAEARDAFRAYLAEDGDPLFRQMALTQLGVSDEDLGDYRSAHHAFAEAARLDGPDKMRAEIGVARTLARLGDRNGAIAAYRRFLNKNPFARERSEVIEALAQMGAPPEAPRPSANNIDNIDRPTGSSSAKLPGGR
jgi:tetratricopeptide (TPR) repeat protein